MSIVEITKTIGKGSFKLNCADNRNLSNNNNNNNINNNNKDFKSNLNVISSDFSIDSNSIDSIHMSPGSNTIRSSGMHSPKLNQNNSDLSGITPQNTNSLSPSSVSPRTMSPPNEHRNGFLTDGIANYQQNFANAVAPYQTSVQPKKSFCIDALLSKNHQSNGDHSPEANRFLSDDDIANKYSDDQREYMSSPEDGISR